MQVQSIKNGGITLYLTVEDCSMLSQACALAEDKFSQQERPTANWRWSASFFATMMLAGMLQMGCRADVLRDLDVVLEEQGLWHDDIDILPD